MFVGRAPTGPRVELDVPVSLVVVESPNQEVSSNHLELRAEGEVLIARDLHATNGSVVHLPDGRRRRLNAGAAMAVPVGSTIDLGDGVLLRVLEPKGVDR